MTLSYATTGCRFFMLKEVEANLIKRLTCVFLGYVIQYYSYKVSSFLGSRQVQVIKNLKF